MVIKDAHQQYYPSEGKALLIIERQNKMNMAVENMFIWDITRPMQPVPIGYLASTMKAAYELEPGEHTILLELAAMVNIMKIEVAAGKTYFCEIGIKDYGAYFHPVKKGMPNKMTRNGISVPTEELIRLGNDRRKIELHLQLSIEKGRRKHSEMSDEERQRMSMRVEDGR